MANLFVAQAAGQGVVPAPHRAVYEMTLAEARGGAGVTQVTGRMVYELTGSACEGYTQNMRFVTSMANQSGSATVSDLRSSSWEDASGKRFRFSSSQFRDDKPTEATAGDATRAPTGSDVKVELTKPAKKDLSLRRASISPSSTRSRCSRRRAPARRYSAPTCSTGPRRARRSAHRLLHRSRAARRRQPPAAGRQGRRALHRLPAWPVSIGYFEPGTDKKDAVPVYELMFLFFENGVSRQLFIDYGEFAIQGEIKEITFLEPRACEQQQGAR